MDKNASSQSILFIFTQTSSIQKSRKKVVTSNFLKLKILLCEYIYYTEKMIDAKDKRIEFETLIKNIE